MQPLGKFSIIGKALPNQVAYDICGVQPLSPSTGTIFKLNPFDIMIHPNITFDEWIACMKATKGKWKSGDPVFDYMSGDERPYLYVSSRGDENGALFLAGAMFEKGFKRFWEVRVKKIDRVRESLTESMGLDHLYKSKRICK